MNAKGRIFRITREILWRAAISLLVAGVISSCSVSTASQPITEIAMQRDCFGCPASTRFVIRSDGTASVMEAGNARSGTADRIVRGAIARDDFDRIARLLVSSNFFALEDSYDDPSLQDGRTIAVSAKRDGQTKTIVSRNDAGPASLQTITQALDELRAKLNLP